MKKTVWITGASSGIGEAMAYQFAGQGARLVLSARRIEELERVRKQCHLSDSEILVLPLDLEKPEEFEDKTRIVLEKFGRIDVLVNNGGITQRGSALETKLDVDKRIFNINYFGNIALTKAVLPTMKAQQSGSIVVISSVVGKFGTPLRTAYSASKHALHGFYDSLRAEVHRDNIQVLLVCPGYVNTPIAVSALKGDGSTFGQMGEGQKNGISPQVAARKIIHAINKRKSEIYFGGKEVLLVYIKRFIPALYRKIILKVKIS